MLYDAHEKPFSNMTEKKNQWKTERIIFYKKSEQFLI